MAFKNAKTNFICFSNQTKCVLQQGWAYSSKLFRTLWYIADFGSSCSLGLGHFFFIFSNERGRIVHQRNRTPTTQVRQWHCTTETVGDALNSLDFEENKKRKINTYEQYVYALTCATRCHQCILWMTRAHSYTRCESFFFMRRFTEQKALFGRGSSHGLKKAKATLALTRPPPPQCRLLPSANCPCMEVETQESAIQKCAPANTRGAIIPLHTRNGTTRARVATSREKRLICKMH